MRDHLIELQHLLREGTKKKPHERGFCRALFRTRTGDNRRPQVRWRLADSLGSRASKRPGRIARWNRPCAVPWGRHMEAAEARAWPKARPAASLASA